jgi:hypothetical protein
MGKDLRASIENALKMLGVTGEVWDEDFYPSAHALLVNLANCLGIEPRALVFEVIAGDTRHGGITEVHFDDGLAHAARLVGVESGWLSRINLAKVAATRALSTTNEESCLSVFPALVDVRASGLLAYRVKVFTLDEALKLLVLRTHFCLGLNPVGLSLNRRFAVAYFKTKELAAIS